MKKLHLLTFLSVFFYYSLQGMDAAPPACYSVPEYFFNMAHADLVMPYEVVELHKNAATYALSVLPSLNFATIKKPEFIGFLKEVHRRICPTEKKPGHIRCNPDEIIAVHNKEKEQVNGAALVKGFSSQADFISIYETTIKKKAIDPNYNPATEWERKVFEMCDFIGPVPERIDSLFDGLVIRLNKNTQESKDLFFTAAQLHCDITEIHPFLDANGRIARLCMNVVLIKNLIKPLYFLDDSEYMQEVRKNNVSTFAEYLRVRAQKIQTTPDPIFTSPTQKQIATYKALQQKNVCFVCKKESTQHCSACKQQPYCSRECQRADWATHKLMCKKPE